LSRHREEGKKPFFREEENSERAVRQVEKRGEGSGIIVLWQSGVVNEGLLQRPDYGWGKKEENLEGGNFLS